MRYEDVTVVLSWRARGGGSDAVCVLSLGFIVQGEGVHSVGYGRIVVMPHSFFRLFGTIFGSEELGPVGRLFGRVGVHGGKTFFKEQLGEVFPVDVQGADEATDFIGGFNVDFYVTLQATPVGEVVGFLAEGLGFLGGVTGGARGPHAGEDECEFGVLAGYEDCEAGAAFNKVDDCRDSLLALEDGGLDFRFLETL